MESGSNALEETQKFLTLAEEYSAKAQKNATGHLAGSGNSGLVYAQLATANAISALASAVLAASLRNQ